MFRFRFLAAAIAALLAAASTLRAQFVYTLEVSGATARYADSPSASGVSLSPGLKLEQPRSRLLASANLSAFEGGEWTAQGLLSASLFTGATHGVRAEVAATANGIAYTGNRHSAYLITEGRLHASGATAGVWGGAGVGQTRSNGAGSTLVLADAGLWWRPQDLTLAVSFTQSRFRSRDLLPNGGVANPGPLVFGPGFAIDDGLQLTDYRDRVLNDAVATVHWEGGALELDASVGARLRSRTDPAQQWATIGGAFWVTNGTAIVASAGEYPESFLQGFPSIHYFTFGLRLSTRPPQRATERVRPVAIAAPARGATAFVIDTSGAERHIRVVAPNAHRVEIMADFTDWLPVALHEGAAGTWELSLPIAPGTYRVSVRLDGGAWAAPPGTPARRDEFGTTAGVVVVP